MTTETKSAGSLPMALILAAGGSTRMGSPKSLLRLGEGTLIEQHIAALTPYTSTMTVVIGAAHELLRRHIPPSVTIVFNADWAATQPADSLRLALQTAPYHRRAWLVPVDTPPATADTLERLLAHGAPAIPVDSINRRGHPALLGDAELAILRAHAPVGGVRTLLDSAPEVHVDDPLIAMNFNSPGDWAAFLKASKPA
jgi:molybdenum cofactor cytidylyltransferase